MRYTNKPLLAAVLLLVLISTFSGGGITSASAPPLQPPASPASTPDSSGIWRDVVESSIQVKGARYIIPARYRTLEANGTALATLLSQAPLEGTSAARNSNAILSLPMPDGKFGRFSIVEAPIMAPALAARFPEIKTYLGQGLDDRTASVRLDMTPAGFHAIILSGDGTVFIDPYSRNDTTHYISYYKREFSPIGKAFGETTVDLTGYEGPVQGPTGPSGAILRTYRLAVAATGEYTIFHGGTVPQGMAAIVTSMNRVTGVYEREVAVRMVLVANNDQIVYTNPVTDPYTNNNGSIMLSQNQTNLDLVIGNANYDIGHVFSTGGGGVANLGVPCRTGFKARGVTGSSQPVGDPFDIDYVAHEIGHQYGAYHTFNGTTANCGGGNRTANAAYEPGSGSTIMAYAGICGAEDLQPNSDDYFHIKSLDEIIAYTTVGSGNSCAVQSATGNGFPTVNAGASYTVPNQTFFKLTGSATDPNGDPLTYTWEQYNLGAASPPNTDNGNRPIFRSFKGTANPSRFFPKLSDILNNTTTLGESLPTTNRTLTYRLTARDNRAGGGGVNDAIVNIPVVTSAGPFLITSPNTAVTWNAGAQETVTWDVANTTAAPVGCAQVDLLLSVNGGLDFSTTLALGTANDGSEVVTVPNLATNQARVQAFCSNNIFFDVSNVNFTIVGGASPTPGTVTSTPTRTATRTSTTISTATNTPLIVLTLTPFPPTSTATLTAGVPTSTGTATQVSATNTPAQATATGTVVIATSTGQPTQTATTHASPTRTTVAGTATATSTACTLSFTDVPTSNTFYPFVQCLACGGIISGYECGGPGEPCDGNNNPYFRPGNDITRGQIAKVVSNSAGFEEDPGTQIFEDVAPGSPFYTWINRLANRGHMTGYPCGSDGEPCGSGSLPYFRPGANATRGQLAKIVSNAASFNDPVTGQTFTDVPPSNPFHLWIERLATRNIMGGYPCGGAGEPCDGQNRAYFRPFNNVTRGQASKIVSGAFFPECGTTTR